MNTGFTILSRLRNRYVQVKVVETILLALLAGLLLYNILYIISIGSATQISLSVITFIAVFFFRFFQIGLQKISVESIAGFLNTRYTELQASTDLALRSDQELSDLAKLQQFQTYRKLEVISNTITFPNKIKSLVIWTSITLVTCISLQVIDFTINSSEHENANSKPVSNANALIEELPAEIEKATIVVQPPAYTGIRSYTTPTLDLTVQEQSQVTWTLSFSGSVHDVQLVSATHDSLAFKQNNNFWILNTTLERSGFYQLIWKDKIDHASDFYKIEIIKDQPPTIKLKGLNQFTQVAFDSNQSIEANPTLTDDYGLINAYIIATVSKGSGESVKFREEKIAFSTPDKISGKSVNAKQILNLKKLGMEPGDELYFYIEAIDNKTPLANRSRTETYFIIIPDTAQDVMAADGGLGVDLMPEYFRSQRQIIIDTEKLIRERKTITKKEFNARSNELGYDQKVLRLRYGQFLGEEAESGIGPVEHHDEDEAEEKPEDMIKEFGHQHDTENEHNLAEEKDPAKRDVDGGKKENLLEGFIHEHDNEESATFFFQSLKVKLKAALAQMWDAELYLRLNEPEKSLLYQYIALKLLKEISNDSRIYVHRTGFEPPPIKEEKRLSADLNDVSNSMHDYKTSIKVFFPKITEALQITENLLARKATILTSKEKASLLQSGNELAKAALENPALLYGLTALKQVTNQKELPVATLKELRSAYWLALPNRPASPGQSSSTLHELDDKLIQQLLRNQ